MTHSWSMSDDIIAFYLFKFGNEKTSYDDQRVSIIKNISLGSLRMRISNFQAIDTGKGLIHFAKQSKKVYEKYKSWSKIELRYEAFPELKTTIYQEKNDE